MKKFIVTILAIFYLGASSGATVQIHYCMGELIDWNISHEKSEKCSNCGMKKGFTEECCKDKQHKLTVKDSPKAAAIIYQFNISGIELPFIIPGEIAGIYLIRKEGNSVINDSPPRTQAVSAFIRNCNFRI